jgi:hypothetical protein
VNRKVVLISNLFIDEVMASKRSRVVAPPRAAPISKKKAVPKKKNKTGPKKKKGKAVALDVDDFPDEMSDLGGSQEFKGGDETCGGLLKKKVDTPSRRTGADEGLDIDDIFGDGKINANSSFFRSRETGECPKDARLGC